jgi:putative membrane protein
MRSHHDTNNHSLMRDAAAGFVAGLAASFAMDMFSVVVRAANHGREAAGAAPGADRGGRGAQPPQARGNAADDAAVRSGAAAYEAVAGHPPPRDLRPWLGSAAHYLFGASAGAIYGVLAPRSPTVRGGFGTVYGAMVWAIADEGVIPALGLSRSPRQLPAGVQLYSLANHWVYGATLESVRRAVAVGGR